MAYGSCKTCGCAREECECEDPKPDPRTTLDEDDMLMVSEESD